MNISGKVAIVTGGCQGIGKGIIYALLKKGAKVAALDINDAKGEALQDSLNHQFGEGRVVYNHCDVADQHQLKDVFESMKRRFSKVDIIVNNAGVGDNLHWEKVIDINLKAVVHGTMLGIEMMDKKCGNNGGAIVNIASMAAIFPLSVFPIYTTTKAGVVAFTRCFKAAALDNGVRVNCICPSFVETELFEKAKSSDPDFEKLAKKVGTVSLGMVVDAVVQTIEDEQLAGEAVIVTPTTGILKYNFPKAKI